MSSPVRLLCHFDGADGSTTITDSSASGHTGTALGSAAIQNSIAEFSGAIAFNVSGDTGDAISFPYSKDFQLGRLDFCLEFWIYFTASGTMIPFDNRGTADGTCWTMYCDSGSLHFVASEFSDTNNGWQLSVTCSQPAPGAWHHIAVTRVTDTFTIYLDGVVGTSQTMSSGWIIPYNEGNAFYIGRGKPGLSTPFAFQGYMDDVRLTVGNAVYFAPFTPAGPLTTSITAAANLDVTHQFGIVSEVGTPALNVTHQFGIVSFRDAPVLKTTHQFGILSYRDDPSFKVTHMFAIVSIAAPLPSPGTLSATSMIGKVRLSWSTYTYNGTPADNYTISRSTSSSGPFTALGGMPVTGTSFDDTTGTIGTPYYYVFHANLGGNSSVDSVVAGPASPENTVTPPSNLTGQGYSNGDVTLNWV